MTTIETVTKITLKHICLGLKDFFSVILKENTISGHGNKKI